MKPKSPSRAQRWNEAASRALEGLETLRELQEEYEQWQDNLPQNLASSPVGEKLQAVCSLNIADALDLANEAEAIDLPQGFGRD